MSDEAASPKISVVVPVYKVEKYLQACVESVLAQSFTDFELILVDDGSPDKSGEICDELAKKDPRIRVFHQENGGVTSARRHGVEQARGEWICFVDSDDLLPSNSLKDLIAEATEDTDLVHGMHHAFNDGETPKEELRTGKVTSFDLAGIVENMFLRHKAPWGKIIRRKLFTPHAFDIPRDIKRMDDVLMNIRLIVNGPRQPKEIDKVVYYYRVLGSSIVNTYLLSESYIFRYFKLLFHEARKITTPSNEERISRALSRYLCKTVTNSLIAYRLPIKFPRRLATLMRRGAKSNPKYFFIYLCLRFGCPGIAQVVAKIYHFLHGVKKADARGKTLIE